MEDLIIKLAIIIGVLSTNCIAYRIGSLDGESKALEEVLQKIEYYNMKRRFEMLSGRNRIQEEKE